MFVWDETDVLTCLEVEPEIEPDAIWYKYIVEKDGLRLELFIYQYDGDIYFNLYHVGVERAVFFMKLIECPGIRYMKDKSNEYLEFAHAKSFGSRYDGESVIPFGVRLWVNPGIRVELF